MPASTDRIPGKGGKFRKWRVPAAIVAGVSVVATAAVAEGYNPFSNNAATSSVSAPATHGSETPLSELLKNPKDFVGKGTLSIPINEDNLGPWATTLREKVGDKTTSIVVFDGSSPDISGILGPVQGIEETAALAGRPVVSDMIVVGRVVERNNTDELEVSEVTPANS